MPAIISALSGLLARLIGDSVIRWLAFKALMVLLIVTVLPIVLNNFLYEIIQTIFDIVSANTGSSSGQVLSYSGLTAWFIQVLKLPECLSVLMAALSVRVALRLIPFVRV